MPATKPEPAGDPSFAVVAPADPAAIVVEAATVPVDETARGVCDQLAEGSYAVLERHPSKTTTFRRRIVRRGRRWQRWAGLVGIAYVVLSLAT